MLGGDDAVDIVRAAMVDLVANFATPTDPMAILETVTTSAVELIREVDFADVLLVDERCYRSVAPTAPGRRR